MGNTDRAPAPAELEVIMKDIFEKCRVFLTAKHLMDAGIYPYFKELASEQAPEVVIEGKKFIMFGSNNYLGLANDPRMKKAATEAIHKSL